MKRTHLSKVYVRTTVLALVVATVPLIAGASANAAAKPLLWAAQSRTGTVQLRGEVPLIVSGAAHRAAGNARFVGAVTHSGSITLNFGFPLRNKSSLNRLIVQEARTHHQYSRAQIYAAFSPPTAQYNALRHWLVAQGFTITHVGRDRLELAAKAPASVIERALNVQLNVYHRTAYTVHGMRVAAHDFYANTTNPSVPARFGLQSISGLSNVSQFFTNYQLAGASAHPASATVTSHVAGRAVRPHVRSGGYFGRDLRSMYDIPASTNYGTGQTMGYTLWGAAENQPAATQYGTVTGDTALAVDSPCTASGNSPTTPSSCTTIHEASGHLVSILENGDTNNNYGSNVETGLDVEISHAVSPGAAEKYYLADCSSTPSPGLSNGNSCNGSDVGMEETIEDAANDSTLHSVSNSWGYGGEAEYGLTDPFLVSSQNNFAIAAAAGTTFYFSTGDLGTFESGYASDSPYVVAIGGTSIFSTQSLTAASAGSATLSTEETWAAGGAWCSNIQARPSWQTGAGVAANASCPGRANPDVSAVADTNTAVFYAATRATTPFFSTGSVGGTSVAAPVMNGIEADTENFLAAQSYPGATPAIGFEGPIDYMLGNSSDAKSYFRDVVCGNVANPSSGPDGEAAQPGWDEATGFGAVDVGHFNIGYALALGATGLSVPSSVNNSYQWSCAKTPGNSSQRGISFPTPTVGFSVGAQSGSPWKAAFLPSGSWGASNTFYGTTDGGKTWVPTNSDMLGVTCITSSTCIEVGDGGVIRRTVDSGLTWVAKSTTFHQALTSVTCPSSTVCYAAGDRGTVLSSSDGGQTWAFSPSVDGNPIEALSCPSTTVCYAVDNYAHVETTSNGGTSWTLESTPVTTPAINVPGSGGPNPFAGLFGVSCTTATTCVAVGGFPPTGETFPPIVSTTDGVNWTLQNSNAGTGNYLLGVSCLPGTTTCYAVGYKGTIVTTTDMSTWTPMASGTTLALNGITCLSTTSCVATGQTGTIDVLSGSTWTPTSTTLGASAFLAGVTCLSATNCVAVGKQGVTLGFDSTNIAGTIAQQAGGGNTGTMNAISCVSATTCEVVGAAGVILGTTNGGQTWLAQTSGTTNALNGVSCVATSCVAVGAAGTIRASSNSGQTWSAQTSGVAIALNAVSCTNSACVAVGAPNGGAGVILTAPNGGTATWSSIASGTTGTLSGVACVSSVCSAVGTVVSGSAVALRSINGGASWIPQSSNSAQALTSVACVDTLNCFAGGAIGTVVATNNGGSTWYQEGDPISGPTSALNAGPTGITAVNAAACTSTACFMGTASSGNMMISPLLTVTVTATSPFGTTPPLSGVAPSSGSISYSPSAAAASVTGALSCSTSATSASHPGTYPVSSCSGLSASGYNVIYNYAGSSEKVTQASQAVSFTSTAPSAPIVGDTYNATATGGGSGNAVTFSIDASSTSGCTVGSLSGTVTFSGPAGSCVLDADQSGSVDYTAAPQASQPMTVGKIAQAIVFTSTAPASPVVGDTYNATATGGGSANPVTFSIDASSTSGCTVGSLSGTVTFSGPAGSCVLDADQAGDASYSAAPEVSQSISVGKVSQAIVFTTAAPGSPVVGDTYDAAATGGGSGNAVTFSIDASSTSGCTVNSVSGEVTFSGPAGSCVLDADQAGDTSYSAAPEVSQSISVGKAAQAILFTSTAPSAPVVGDTYDATATGGASGNAVTFSIDASSTSGCTVESSSGVVTFSGPAGSCVLDADQAGDASYTDAPQVNQSITVGKAAQAIVFTSTAPSGEVVLGSPYDVTATGGASGNPVTFSIDELSTSGCKLSKFGHTVSFKGPAGSCIIDADQLGDASYTDAPQVSQTFTVSKASQVVSFTSTAPSGPVVGDTYDATATGGDSPNPVTFSIDASSTSGCTVGSLSGVVTFSGPAGSCVLDADQAGDASYLAAPQASQSITVGKAAQAVSFTSSAPASPVVGDTYDATATGGASGNPVTFSIDASSTSGCTVGSSSGVVTFSGPAGSCLLDADQAGDASYLAAPQASQSITVGKAAQSVSFTSSAPGSPVVGGSYHATATGGASGNPVTFSIGGSSTSGCTVGSSSGVVTFTGPAGTCVVHADQAGNASYLAATQATQSLTVGKASQSLGFTSSAPSAAKVGGSYQATATGGASGNSVTFSIGGSSTSGCTVVASSGVVSFTGPAGSCVIHADQAGNASYFAAPQATQTVTVGKATPTVALTATPASAKLGPVTFHVTVTGVAGTTVTGTVAVSDGTRTCHTATLLADGTGSCLINEPAGTYTETATYSGDASYTVASKSITKSVAKWAPTVVLTPSANPAKKGSVSYHVSVKGVIGTQPTGSVTITDGKRACTFTLNPTGGGSCALNEPVGTFTITAVYNGDSNYLSAFTSLSETVHS